MIGELLLAAAIVLAINLSAKDKAVRAYRDAGMGSRIEMAKRLEQAYYDSLRQHYDSLDIK